MLLTLFLLAPITAEVVTGSTPILVLLANPLAAAALLSLYGSGAILAREVARRRELGWPSILLLGAAYGILEEGLITTSWFNPNWPDVCTRTAHAATGLCDYGRVWNTNLIWALTLTMFHATISIAIPILLTEHLFPSRAAQPWLRRRGQVGFGLLLGAVTILGSADFGFLAYRQQGYSHPPIGPYLAALALGIALVALALRLRPPTREVAFIWTRTALMSLSRREVPRAWLLRALAFLAVVAYFFVPATMQSARIPAPATLVVLMVLYGLLAWRILTWSRKTGWGARQELALATGALGFFLLVLDPVLEIQGQSHGKSTHGTLVVAVTYLAGLIWLSLRAWHAYRRDFVVS